MVGLNFSSATTPELLLKTFDHYCEYRRTPNGVVMSPIQLGKWVVLFCDEINLPDTDKYGEWEEGLRWLCSSALGDGYLLVLLEKSLIYSCELFPHQPVLSASSNYALACSLLE